MTKYQDNVLVKQIKSHIELQRNKDTTLHFEKPTSSIIEISDDSFKEAKYSIDLQKNAAEMTTSKGKGLGSSGAASININSTFNKIQGGISLLKRKIVEHEKIQENDHGKVRATHIEKDVENRFEKRYEKEKMKERMRMREMELERERERKAREIETVQSFGRDEWSEELMKRKLEPLKVEVTSESSSESSSDGSSEGSDVENDHKKRNDEKDERDDKKTNGNWKGLLKSMAAESEQQKLEAEPEQACGNSTAVQWDSCLSGSIRTAAGTGMFCTDPESTGGDRRNNSGRGVRTIACQC
ncbi:hypothetical protein AX774_g2635 [Zancudomyces culisetae]|uniref:Uncharacterized protein n=1 Tax=Zancudomyces culisetae TaxID=1213189 RepID=A0A1R1PSC6_ZANCU|nr:hypothetical protein AX774_g2635 [Zancudomyces culisetae]|eukprot:OMH83854.1 hypothetical protein AX774_g2635 [Zancudomyces culisetae]